MEHTLSLQPEEMRTLGYKIIDAVVEHYENLKSKSVTNHADRAAMEKMFGEGFSEQGDDPFKIFDRALQQIFTNLMLVNHPRFFAFVYSPSNIISAYADALASAMNVFAGTWIESSSASQIEITTIDWLRKICGMPETAGGLFVSGGSVANLTALAAARHIHLNDNMHQAIIYFSNQTHSCVERALRVLGFGRDQMRKIPSDETFRLPVDSLEEGIAQDRRAGKRPFCVVANAGTTNTAAVDPLLQLASLCQKERLWFHVDGAFGAAAVLTEKGRLLLKGMEQADSLVLDPHKWLFQPFEIGCVLLKEKGQLRETFQLLPEYMRDVESKQDETNFCDYGIQLTRSFRAFKLWASLKVFGVSHFTKAIEWGISLGEIAEQRLRASGQWEIITPAQLATLTFRYVPGNVAETKVEDYTTRIVEKIMADGFMMMTSTELRGKKVLRMCTMNPRTTEQDVLESIDYLERIAKEVTHG